MDESITLVDLPHIIVNYHFSVAYQIKKIIDIVASLEEKTSEYNNYIQYLLNSKRTKLISKKQNINNKFIY